MPNTAIQFDPSPLVAYYDNMSQEIFKMKDYMQQVKTQRENEFVKTYKEAKQYPLYNKKFKDIQVELFKGYDKTLNDIYTKSGGRLSVQDQLKIADTQNNLFAAQQAMLIEEARIKAQREAYEKNPEIYDDNTYYGGLKKFYEGGMGVNLLEPKSIDAYTFLNTELNKVAVNKKAETKEVYDPATNSTKAVTTSIGMLYQTLPQKEEFVATTYDTNSVFAKTMQREAQNEKLNPNNLSAKEYAIKTYAPKLSTEDINIRQDAFKPNSGGNSNNPIFQTQQGEHVEPVFEIDPNPNAPDKTPKDTGFSVIFKEYNSLTEGKKTGRISLDKPVYNLSTGKMMKTSLDDKYDMMGYGRLGNKTYEKNTTKAWSDWEKYVNHIKKSYKDNAINSISFATITNTRTKERFLVPFDYFATDKVLDNVQEYTPDEINLRGNK